MPVLRRNLITEMREDEENPAKNAERGPSGCADTDRPDGLMANII